MMFDKINDWFTGTPPWLAASVITVMVVAVTVIIILVVFSFRKRCRQCGEKDFGLDNGICTSCRLENEMRREIHIRCPRCGERMKKKIVEEVIIDYCKKHGVWLDKDELEELLNLEQDSSTSASTIALLTVMATMTAVTHR